MTATRFVRWSMALVGNIVSQSAITTFYIKFTGINIFFLYILKKACPLIIFFLETMRSVFKDAVFNVGLLSTYPQYLLWLCFHTVTHDPVICKERGIIKLPKQPKHILVSDLVSFSVSKITTRYFHSTKIIANMDYTFSSNIFDTWLLYLMIRNSCSMIIWLNSYYFFKYWLNI